MKSILDKTFPYRDSHNTDVTVSWEKAREQLKKDEEERERLRKQIEQIPTIGKARKS